MVPCSTDRQAQITDTLSFLDKLNDKFCPHGTEECRVEDVEHCLEDFGSSVYFAFGENDICQLVMCI